MSAFTESAGAEPAFAINVLPTQTRIGMFLERGRSAHTPSKGASTPYPRQAQQEVLAGCGYGVRSSSP